MPADAAGTGYADTARGERLRERLHALGFDEVRFASAAGCLSGGLRAWLGEGHHADMDWIARTAEKRLDPAVVLPGIRSVIALGVNYWRNEASTGGEEGSRRPAWARYALHEDYHDTVKPGLVAAGRVLEELFGVSSADYRYYVDTGPVLEREWASRGGLGFIGRNTMLISRRHGNWLLLSAILTRIPLEPDPPIALRVTEADRSAVGLLCGKCTRCLDACPTAAFPAPGVLDARRCISYQTIENKGIIPRELRAGIGRRIYGCDVCLEVCPWNRFASEGRSLLLAARGGIASLTLFELLKLTPARFAEIFRRTPIKRLKLRGLLRNACVVAGNSGDKTLLPALERLAQHEQSVVRAHAVWAVFQLAGSGGAVRLLDSALAAEADPDVLAEYVGHAMPVPR